MKISGIRIKRFGVWQDLSLPMHGGGMSVVYGPNEAGKSTLMRFIRGALFGFDPFGVETASGRVREMKCEGALDVIHRGQPCEIRRVSSRGTRGLVCVSGLNREEPSDSLLGEILSNVDETIFQNVLAVGLPEIQELATLHDDEVAQHIYGLSLGPEGRRLLEISTRCRNENERLFDHSVRAGELIDRLERERELIAECETQHPARSEHAELCRERNSLESRIESLQARQDELKQQLRGHQFLERVWAPWNQIREYEAELEEVPFLTGFPENGLARLNALETDLSALTARHDGLVADADGLKQRGDSIRVPAELLKHAATMQSFIDQRDWLEEAQQSEQEARARTSQCEGALQRQLAELGPEWTLERLEQIDESPAAQGRLASAAAKYRGVLVRRGRLKRRLKRLSARNHRQSSELAAKLKDCGASSIEEAVAKSRARLSELENLGRLRLEEHEVELRQRELSEQVERFERRPGVPRWFPVFLGILALAGAGVTVLGIQFGLTTNALAGASFALLGLTGLGIVWGFRGQFGHESHRAAASQREELRRCDEELRATREKIARLVGAQPGAQELSAADLIQQGVQRLSRLEQLSERQNALQAQRRRLTELRLRFRAAQRDLAAQRQSWCELLTRLGLPESTRIDATFELWEKLLEAAGLRRELRSAETELQSRQKELQRFCGRMQSLMERLQRGGDDLSQPAAVLASWEQELQSLAESRAELRRIRESEKERRREAAEIKGQIDELRMQRSVLLVQAGAANREEFDQRAGWVAQRKELEELIAMAQEELDEAAGTEPEFAVVEEDLLDYDAETNSERIREIGEELKEAERELHAAFESIGRVKQSIDNLERDPLPARLSRERAEATCQLRAAAEEWFAALIAGRALEEVRTQFERTCQPAVLASAGRYLERLTRGRYRNVWTPLDRRDLRIDDDHGYSYRVDQLSGGTREQLFLAVRLAVIREFTRRGIELPMILDDILVNFDQVRTEAAVDTLLDYAAEGQQILFFTCHLHLAHLFESRGIEPTWLPGHNPPLEERRAG